MSSCLRARCGVILVPLLIITLALTGCRPKKKPQVNFNSELPPGQLGLRKIPPEQYPDFSKATWNLDVLARAVDASLEYNAHPSSQQFFPYLDIDHPRVLATLRAFRQLVDQAKGRPDAGAFIDSEVRRNYEVYKSIGAPNPAGPGYTDRVLFTGYFTPIYDASLTRTGPYQWPLYKRPSDLATDPVTGETIGRKNTDGSVAPYLTRAQIEGPGKPLANLEYVYLKSRWEAYVITVQGSARLKLTDGRMLEIGYSGHNGYEYTSPGRAMVADGVIKQEQLNLKALGNYFGSNPQAADKYLGMNQRTVFFTERQGGPFGSLNVPVTTWATIATDKNQRPNIYPRSMPAFLNVPVPREDNPTTTWRFQGFMMDQDSGGAIRAAGRTDIYMGIGSQAEALAGHQLHEGELYYIALKPELIPQFSTPHPAERIR